MKIYDVSMTISEDMQVYKNLEEKKPNIRVVADFSNASYHETEIQMNLHTGTHMDFPLHMIKDGKTSDTLDLSKLIRKVKVIDMTKVIDCIKDTDLLDLDIKPNDFLLFKTINSYDEKFMPNFIYIAESASNYLASKQIAGVGVDGLGVERNQKEHPTHKNLMSRDMIIIEGLRLKEVNQGMYFMYALPIKIRNSDALPLSIILIEEPYENNQSNT
ncbi:MAG: cyclase family protein [Firmicutes bacterium]|nr:cyclase family protein [Bacillota bacterium]